MLKFCLYNVVHFIKPINRMFQCDLWGKLRGIIMNWVGATSVFLTLQREDMKEKRQESHKFHFDAM